MVRNLDLAALRSLIALDDTGGVTRAAAAVNLTQSAVSMQLKRLEQSLGLNLIDRSGRGARLTREGEQLLSYARRLLSLNDEAVTRLTAPDWEGELTIGAPHDVIHPHLPTALAQFARLHPRVSVRIVSDHSRRLRELFDAGEAEVILTTEAAPAPGGRTLARAPLVWVGATGGRVWRERPLRLSFCRNCAFRAPAIAALDAAGIAWSDAIDSDSDHAMEAALSADLAVAALLEGGALPSVAPVPAEAGLPGLPDFHIALYVTTARKAQAAAALGECVRGAWPRGATLSTLTP